MFKKPAELTQFGNCEIQSLSQVRNYNTFWGQWACHEDAFPEPLEYFYVVHYYVKWVDVLIKSADRPIIVVHQSMSEIQKPAFPFHKQMKLISIHRRTINTVCKFECLTTTIKQLLQLVTTVCGDVTQSLRYGRW